MKLFENRYEIASNMRYRLLYMEAYKNRINKKKFYLILLLDIRDCFPKIDYIFFPSDQFKNILYKTFVFPGKSDIEELNDYSGLFYLLDEVFDEYKYENLRFILELKNSEGDIKVLLKR